MQSALRIGRLGMLTIYLNYTWLIAKVLGLWWVALLWLPDNYPRLPGWITWLVAVLVMILFLASVIAHELVHSTLARSGYRNVNLYPFGSAVPLRLQELEPARALVSSIAAPLFNLALGGLLLLVSGSVGIDFLRALLIPLGWLNVAFGVINLIPGIPFDGGWILSSAISLMNNDREGATRIARTLGLFASLLLVLTGAYYGLATKMWLVALSLVLLGWAAREAASIGRQRGLMRAVFDQIRARDVMDTVRPADAVMQDDTIADMVNSHMRYAPDTPLPVVDDNGATLGVVTLAASEEMLQGTWPTTPARSMMTPVSQLKTVRPNSSLSEILAITDARRDTPEQDDRLPVISDGKLVGSVDPGRLGAFEQVEQEFGVDSGTAPEKSAGALSLLRAALLPIMLIITMAILGNLALNTDPAEIRDIAPDTTITFGSRMPADGAIVGVGQTIISVEIAAASDINTATLSLDGTLLDATLQGVSPLTQTLSVTVPGITSGIHEVLVRASTAEGAPNSTRWQFRASPSGAQASPTPITATPLAPVQEAPRVSRYIPAIGGRVLAVTEGPKVGLNVQSATAPIDVRVTLDGKEIESKVAPITVVEDQYTITAVAPALSVGSHQVSVQIGGHSFAWTFSALQPDADNAYFKETGYFVSQPFLQYWNDNGGVRIFGYPISDMIQETIQGTDEVYSAQYFERARFEMHAGQDGQITLGRVGALLGKPEPPTEPKAGAQFFPATGHNVSGAFLDFWNSNGGLALFGYPVTEELTEINTVDGKEYTVQYFERNRFELHPELVGSQFEVQLGQLGAQMYRQRYGP